MLYGARDEGREEARMRKNAELQVQRLSATARREEDALRAGEGVEKPRSECDPRLAVCVSGQRGWMMWASVGVAQWKFVGGS